VDAPLRTVKRLAERNKVKADVFHIREALKLIEGSVIS
jgi:hypothetical protein